MSDKFFSSSVTIFDNKKWCFFTFYFLLSVWYCNAQTDSTSTNQVYLKKDSITLQTSLPLIYYQTGAIGTVKGNTLQSLPASSIDHSLQGQMAGVWAMQTTAMPAGLVSVWIRGYNSEFSRNQPLYVIDGIPLYYNSSLVDAAYPHPLSLINPYDVASIEVIKDATASKYGMRGYNGVVLINMRKGQMGKPRVSFVSNVGLQKPIKLLPIMNAEEYITYINEIEELAGQPLRFSDEKIDSIGAGTNWQKELFRTAPVWQNHLTIDGGIKAIQYNITGSYLNQQGVVKNSDFERYTARASLNIQPISRLSIQPQINYYHATSNLIPPETIENILSFSPTVPVKDSTGNYHPNESFASEFYENPLMMIETIDNQYQSTQWQTNILLDYQPIDSIHIRLRYGNNKNEGKYEMVPEDYALTHQFNNEYKEETYIIEPSVSYLHPFGKHTMGITVSGAYQKLKQETLEIEKEDSVRFDSYYSSMVKVKYITPFQADLSYEFDHRYVLLLVGRYDTYGFINKVHNFSSSVGLAWHVHQEAFASEWEHWNELTFRGSYGKINANNSYYDLISGFKTILNANQQWNIGMNASFLHNRVQVTLDAYQKTAENAVNISLSPNTGYSSARGQVTVRNRGFESTLISKNIIGDFSWSSGFNITWMKNKMMKLPDNFDRITSRFSYAGFSNEEGFPIGSYYGYIANVGQLHPQTGGLSYQDLGNDGKIDYEDMTVIGNAQPTWVGGMQHFLNYHRWSFEIFLNYNIGNEIYNAQKYLQQSGYIDENQFQSMLYRWSPNRPDSNIPYQLGSIQSSYLVENASFLRVRNIMLSYQIPFSSSIRDVKLYISAQNLITLTKYEGYDPEVSQFGRYGYALGVDLNSYPRAKTFLIGCHFSL